MDSLILWLYHLCLLLVHTGHVDNIAGLSQQESVAQDAAERVSDALVEAGVPDLPVTCSPFRLGVRSGEADCWGVSPWLWRLRVAMLHVPSLGWASHEDISSLVGHFTFRALVRKELLATFRARTSNTARTATSVAQCTRLTCQSGTLRVVRWRC